MKKFTINDTIKITVELAILALAIASITILANFVWWLTKPTGSNVLENVSALQTSDKVALNIINSAPFGVIQKKVEAEPVVADDIKVVGVYAGGQNNSIAFLLVNSKSQIAKIGDSVLSNKVKAILPNGVVLSNGSDNITIEISAGTSSPNSPSANRHDAPRANDNHNDNNNQNNNQQANTNNTQSQQPTTSPSSGNGGMEDVVAQRRKMIEQFQQQNNNN